MSRFNFASLGLLVLSMTTSSLTLPTSRPFKIIVATPTSPTLTTTTSLLSWYLTSSGSVTSTASSAALCHTTDAQLYCGSASPIGAAVGDLTAKLTAFTGDDAVSTNFSYDAETGEISWASEEFLAWGGEAKGSFWLNTGPEQEVWARFGGVSTEDAVPARLLAVFE